MKTVLWLVCMIPLLLKTCLSSDENSENKVLAEVEGERIYLEEALEGMPKGLSAKDSAIFVKEFLNNRINDLLVYNKAVENITQTKELEKMVESYRRSLMIYEYQQRVLNERFKSERSEEEIKLYYEEHRSRFTTDNHLVKGLFIKVPSNAPKLANLKQWMLHPDEKNLPRIESYCVQYASVFNPFMDQWTPLNEVVGSVPSLSEKGSGLLQEGRTFEVTEDGSCYILYVSEQVSKGDVAPFEYIEPVVVNVMLNAGKAAFLKQLEADLKKKAIEDGELTLYN
jgi:hypothetical protein